MAMTKKWQISRRTMIRGIGAGVGLPLLNAMGASSTLASSVSSNAPTRLAFLFVPNGVNLAKWTPTRTDYNYDLPETLRPLARLRNEVSVLSGLTHDKGRANSDGAGDHARSAGVFLTAAQPKKTSGGDIRAGISVDQVAAQHIGKATRFSSLELSCEKGRNSGNCDSGYSCAYSYNISWASPTTPMAQEVDPRLVFERLFANVKSEADREALAERNALRKSLLDYVQTDASRLQRRLGQSDKRKMDEYLTAIREIERRIQMAEVEAQKTNDLKFKKPEGIPQAYVEHVRLMTDMMVLAFQTDSTRIATCMFGRAGSNRSYREIDVPDGHHDLSHHGGNKEKLEKIARINNLHVQQLAYFLSRLKSVQEGEGNLLDNSMIVYGSGLSDGNRHNNEDLPILLAGRGGGTLEPGRHIKFRRETPMANLFLSLLDRMDVNVDRFGDSTGRLPFLV